MTENEIKIETVAKVGNIFTYHLVMSKPEGQYRGTLEFNHKPTDVELKGEIAKWRKGIECVKM